MAETDPAQSTAHPDAARAGWLDRVHPGLLYTVARAGIFVVLLALLYGVGFRSFLLFAGAALLSLPVSYFLLRNQRAAFAQRVEGRVSKRQAEKARLRAALAGDDDPA